MLVNIGPTEVIVALVILTSILGGKKVVSMARDLGETSKQYKKIKNEISSIKIDEDKKPV